MSHDEFPENWQARLQQLAGAVGLDATPVLYLRSNPCTGSWYLFNGTTTILLWHQASLSAELTPSEALIEIERYYDVV